MRNNLTSLGIMSALFLAVAGVSFAISPQQPPEQKTPPPAAQSETKPPPASETAPKKEAEKPAVPAADGKTPERFVPTQKTSADNNATFPVDI